MKSIGLKHSIRIKCAIAFCFLIFFSSLSSIKDASGQELGGVCNRTYEVYITLVQILSRGNCYSITADDLATITTIRLLRNRGLDSLQAGDLDDLVNLEVLHLSGNNFERLPDDLFKDLTSLKKLYIFDNNLVTLPDLSALTNLEILDVSQNALESLPDLSAFANLEILDASQNSLTSLPDFPANSALKIFDVHSNRITAFPDFSLMPSLEYLDMGRNSVWRNRPDFSSSSNLTHLFLNNNALTSFPDISSLTSLQVLDLSVNYLSGAFSREYFKNIPLTGLKGVNLSQNPRNTTPVSFPVTFSIEKDSENDKHFTVTASHYLPLILPINVSINTGRLVLPDGVLSNNLVRPQSRVAASWKYVEVDQATLGVTVRSAQSLINGYRETFDSTSNTPRDGTGYSGIDIQEKIQSLIVGICDRTQQVQDAILAQLPEITDCSDVSNAHLSEITLLNLSEKSIMRLQSIDFRSLSSLIELNLSGNSLTSTVPVDLFAGLTALTELNLSGNSLTSTIPEDLFAGLSSLTELNLSHNALGLSDVLRRGAAVPADLLDGLSSLTELNLSHNYLGNDTQPGGDSIPLPDTFFAGLSSLTTLNLSSNQISIITSTTDTDLPNSMPTDLSSLTDLDLEANGLLFIPETVSQMTTLRRLNLTDNSLFLLSSETFRNLSKLEILRLNDNLLSRLPEDIFVGLKAINTLWLYHPGGPLSLTVTLEQTNNLNEFVFKVREGAPADLNIQVSVTGGVVIQSDKASPGGMVRIAKGENQTIFSVNQLAADIILTVDSAAPLPPPAPPDSETGYTGLMITIATQTLTAVQGVCDRTPEVRDALLAKIDNVTNCRDVTDAHLNAMTGTLDLSYPSTFVTSALTDLKSWDFNDLSSLEVLDLSENTIPRLTNNAFQDLTNLRTLDLSGNGLQRLPLMERLTELRRLDISRSSMTRLSVPLSPLTQLTHFDASDSGLQILRSVSRLTQLTHFDVSGNQLDAPPEIANATGLRHFDVSNNRLQTLPNVANLTDLRHFDVSDNQLDTLPDMRPLINLTVLNASGNSLTDFPSVTNLMELTRLDLSSNNLTTIPSGALAGLIKLDTLRLDTNRLGTPSTALPEGIFVGLEALTTVWLNENPRGFVNPVTFPLNLSFELTNTPNTLTLTVREGAPTDLNVLVSVEGGIIDGGTINGEISSKRVTIARGTSETVIPFTQTAAEVTLSLSEPSPLPTPNPIDSETGYKGLAITLADTLTWTGICNRTPAVRDALLEKLPHISECKDATAIFLGGISGTLDLSHPSTFVSSALTELKSWDFHTLSGLEGLNLSGNQITSMSNEAFMDLESLLELNVSANGLTALPAINGLTTLTYFDVSGNALTELSGISTLTQVTYFDVSNNRLTELPSVASLTNLTNLDASGNSLTAFPSVTGLTALTRLDLSENEIGELPSDAFSGLSGLEIIRLDDNNLEILPPGIFIGLESLNTLWLDKNPEEDSSGFTLTLRPEETEDEISFVIKVREGAPGELTAQASLEGGTSSSPTVTIAPGTRETTLEFTPSASTATLTLRSPTPLPGPNPMESESGYKGLIIAVDETPLSTELGICDRTLEVRNALLGKINGIASCRDVTVSHLEGVSGTLDLSYPSTFVPSSALTALKEQDFRYLRGLEGLDLSGNQVTSMSNEAFMDLESLLELDVSANGLTALPAINGLTTLTYFDVSGNALTELSGISTLTKLTHFDVSNNELTGLPSVANLTNLTNLDASGNSLTAFPSLTGLTALTRLDLSENEIGELPLNAFANLSDLEIIRLDDNNLEMLPEGIFIGLESLNTLWLDKNPEEDSSNFTLTLTPEQTEEPELFMIKVEEGAPAELTAQASLEGGTLSSQTVRIVKGMSETRLVFTQTAPTVTLTLSEPTVLPGPESIDSETGYKGLTIEVVDSLTRMGICDRTPEVRDALLAKINGIMSCRDVTVSHLEGVSGTLDLSYPSALSSPLTALKAWDFRELGGLEGLDLSGNTLESLADEAFSDLDSLTELNVSGNALEGLPDLTRLTQLRNLDVSENELIGLSDVSMLGELRYLDVSGNKLEDLPAMNGLTNLTTLKASGNVLPYLPAVNGLTNLTYFDVSGNQLTGLPAVSALTKVTHFDVSANSLVGLPDVTGLEALTNLDASGNSLSAFPDVTGLTALTRLDLSGNGIRDLPSDAFSGLSGLEIIRLDDNELTSLPQGVFVGLEGLTTVWLDGNPKSSPQDFTLTLTPEVDGTGFVIKVREGAPGDLTAQASLEGGTPSTATVTIAQGMSETLFTFTRTASTATLTLRSPTALSGPNPTDSETGYKGLVVAVVSTPTTSTLGICDRTPEVQEALLEKIAGVTDCRAVTVSQLEGVSGTLDLSHPSAVTTALTTLKAWDFRDLIGLEGLDLSGNSITSMSDDLFMDLESLVELDVSGNGLTGLPTVNGLTGLTSLDVSANALSVLPAVNGLTELTFLDVSGNALSGLPDISTLTKVTNLDASGNDLTVFPDLTGLTALTRLDLSGNEIGGDLPSDAFSGLSGLEIIRLDDNELTGLEEEVFVGLESLTTVWLDGNPKSSSPQDFTLTLTPKVTDDGTGFVIKVREGAPGDLTAQASLAGGTLSSPTVTIAQGTSETLLAFTQTASIATLTLRSPTALSGPNPSDSETGYKGLVVAVVSTPVTSTLGICDRTPEVRDALLAKIDGITSCRDVTVSHLESVSGTLDLSHPSVLTTALTGLKEQDLKDLRGLEGLNLSGNSIESLSSDAFSDLESLTELDVSGNGLTGLPAVNGLTTLTSLKAFGNALPYLPAVNGLVNLTYFDVSGNELTGLPDVSALTKVTHFDVSANSLVGLPDVTGLEALTNLDASGNALSVFPDLTGLTALTRLDLSGNGIEELPSDAFSGLSGLEIIRLDDNELTSLPQGVFVGLEGLTTVWLNGNPKSSSPRDFTLTLTPEGTEDGTGFVIKVREGAPGELSAQASLEGGTLSSSTVTIAQGTDETMLSFTQTAAEVTLTLRSPTALPGPDPADSETGYKGLVIAVGGSVTPLGICDRTLAVQEALLEKIVGITDCRAVTVSQLEGVSGTLDLSHPSAVTTALTALKDWDFRDLRGLEGLDLSGNAITSMSDALFTDFESLVELDVSGNGLTVLPAVNGLTGLTSLDVSANALSVLPAVNGLTELTFLDVSGNALSGLPDISTLTKVTNLDASGNDLTVFPDLTGLTSLTRLDLSGNEIGGNLPSDAFSGLSGLEIIRLDDNELTGLEEGVFVGLESLTTVWLDGNPKSSSPQDFTLTLTPEAMDEGIGFVIRVREGAPGDLTAQASLEGGTLSSPTVTIAQGTSETTLEFTSSAPTVTLTLRSPTALSGPNPSDSETGYKGLIVAVVSTPATSTLGICDRTLAVQEALLEKIAESTDCRAVTVSQLERISGTLDLSSPSVLSSPLTGLKEQDLKDLRGLEGLNLSGNSIESLSSDAFSDLESLTELDVSGNGLEGLPAVNGLTTLTSLKAFGNALPYLPAVNGLTELTYFDVSGNELTGLPDVSALTKVTHFDVSANSLVGLPDVTGLEALTNLDASGNALSVFPDLTGLTALTRLDLSGNGIEDLPSDAFSGLSGLEIIRLDDNELTSLPQGIFVGLESLTTVWLDGNPKSSSPRDFTLTLTPEETDDGTGFAIKVREGAPAELSAQANLEGGTLSSSTVTIAQGTDETMLAFTQTVTEVTLTLSSPTALPGPDPADSETGYKGLVIAVGGPLTPLGICDRTPEVQEALLEKIVGVTDCRAVTVSHLEGVSGTLDLSHPSPFVSSALTALKDWDFRDLRGLEGLDLSGNSITSMSDALFTDFDSLVELDVSRNGLTVLPAVNTLTALTSLDVSGNALSGLPDISTLTKVTNLDASGNDLTVFPDLTGLTALTRLDLSGNEIGGDLPSDAFSGLSGLEIIRLDDNELTGLEEGVFVGLESLTTVWLDGNPKSSLPQDFILILRSEATDDGTGFVIKVREGAPGDLTVQADLEGGTPTSQTVRVVKGTSETLLAFTQTASTATLTLRSPSTLPGPDPANSETGYKGLIVAVVSAAASTQGICDRTLEVQQALLEKIAEATDCRAVTVSQLERISGTLDLSSPSVLSSPLTGLKEQDLKDLRGLEGLNLSGNSIESLSSDAFSDLESLTELDVSGNGLTSLPAVNGLTTLTSLKAFGNALPYLPAVNGLVNLTYFDVSGNELTGLPDVSALTKVTHFDVSANSLVGLPDVTGLEALTNLDASGNALSVFPDLMGLTALTRLDLSGNGIEELPSDAFSGLSGLEIIRLDDNELTSLPQGIFVGLESLTTVWLDGNPKSSSPRDFTLTLTPEETEDGTGFAIKVREGAPGELSAQASLEGGTLSSSTVTIAQGTDETMLSFTQTATEVTLTLRSPTALPGPDPADSETGYKGLVIAVGGSVTPLGICDRTLAVQEALLEKIVGVTDCRAVTVSQLEGVSGTLDLSHPSAVTTALTALKDWDFRDLRGLEGLDLSGNSITSMSDGLFADLESLVELDVSGNGLTGLPAVNGLTGLTSLDVSANALSVLPAVNGLTELTFLDVSGNALSSLPDISTLTKVTNLDASGNDLTVFPDLTGLSGLTRLDLSGNEIGGNLPSDAFSGLSGLEIIRLDDNELTGLEEGVFVGLES